MHGPRPLDIGLKLRLKLQNKEIGPFHRKTECMFQAAVLAVPWVEVRVGDTDCPKLAVRLFQACGTQEDERLPPPTLPSHYSR